MVLLYRGNPPYIKAPWVIYALYSKPPPTKGEGAFAIESIYNPNYRFPIGLQNTYTSYPFHLPLRGG
jgi:hypothetical protein